MTHKGDGVCELANRLTCVCQLSDLLFASLVQIVEAGLICIPASIPEHGKTLASVFTSVTLSVQPFL